MCSELLGGEVGPSIVGGAITAYIVGRLIKSVSVCGRTPSNFSSRDSITPQWRIDNLASRAVNQPLVFYPFTGEGW
jgi:hypothetical protein